MEISVLPQKPAIFIGQEFCVEISFSGNKQKIMWCGAQISGIAISKDQISQPLFLRDLPGSYAPDATKTVFNFVMSGSRMIATDFYSPSTFLLNLLIDKTPPSYRGKSIDIDYELCIFAQISGKNMISKKIPITILTPKDSVFSLIQTQTLSSFEMKAIKNETKDNNFSTISPFNQVIPKQNRATAILENENGLNISIETDTISTVGSFLYCIIDLTNSKERDLIAFVDLISKEIMKDSSKSEINNIIVSQKCNLNNTLMKQFQIFIPYDIGTSFDTEIFSVHYEIQISIEKSNKGDNDKKLSWEAPIDIYPPPISISTPRTIT